MDVNALTANSSPVIGMSSHDRQLQSELDRQVIEAIYTMIPRAQEDPAKCNADRIAAFRTMIARARKTLPSTAMLAQIAGQARGLLGRSGLVVCVERSGIDANLQSFPAHSDAFKTRRPFKFLTTETDPKKAGARLLKWMKNAVPRQTHSVAPLTR
jgi:hypothetical protein